MVSPQELQRRGPAKAADHIQAILPGEKVAPFIVGEDSLDSVNPLQRIEKRLQGRATSGLVGGARFFQLKSDQVGSRRLLVSEVLRLTVSAEMNADPTMAMARVHQNHSRILANSVSSAPRPPASGELVTHAANGLDERLAGSSFLRRWLMCMSTIDRRRWPCGCRNSP